MSTENVKLHTEEIEYRHREAVLEGHLAYDEARAGRRPGVLIVHDWSGLGPQVRNRAAMLAGAGYAAFAIDMYGKGNRPASMEEMRKFTTAFRADRPLMRSRAAAGLDVLRGSGRCNARCAAIGYCFGGLTALELARSGADLAGVVSFHGSLDTPSPADARSIRGKILVCHGADDPHVPPEQAAAFMQEMRDAKVDWQMIFYGGAMHSFAVPGANMPERGLQYNEAVDRRSWQAMLDFFGEVLA